MTKKLTIICFLIVYSAIGQEELDKKKDSVFAYNKHTNSNLKKESIAKENDSVNKKTFLGFNGSIGVHYDIYGYNSKNYSNFRPRYPDNLFRFTANANLRISEYFNIPMSISVTSQETTYNIPQIPEEGIVDYIRNPKNNISITPTWKFIKFKLGTHTPNYSKLTTGNIPVFGVGLELTPETWITEVNYGTSQLAVEPNKKNYIIGAYSQKMFGVRIGKGTPKKFQIILNAVKIKDDINSVTNKTDIYAKPIEGVSFSPLIKTTLFKKVYFETETAVSAVTNNLLSEPLQINNKWASTAQKIITVNTSSNADWAHNSRLEWQGKDLKIGGEINYIGAGYVPAGYRNFEKDILDYKINTSANIIKGKINLSGAIGIRTNNLQKNKAQQTKRFIANLNSYIIFSKSIMLNLAYSNFGFNNTEASIFPQNTKIEMNNNSLTISPIFIVTRKTMQHQFNFSSSFNNFNRFDILKKDFIKTKSTSYLLNYTNSLLKLPLGFNLMTMYYTDNMAEAGTLKTTTFGGGINYSLLKRKLNLGMQGTYVIVKKDNFLPDNRANINIRASYKIFKKTNCTMQYNFNNYAYGTSKPKASFNESRVQLSITQTF